MIIKVITLVSLASVCKGELSPSYIAMPNQALSSQSYHRGDVPLSYKFTSIHPQSNNANQKVLHSKHGQSTKQRPVQYAPLTKPDEQRYHEGLQPKIHSPHNLILHTKDEQKQFRRDHLEPKLHTSSTSRVLPQAYKPFEYVPGHNIEVLQSINREPGHNHVYKSYPGMQSERNIKHMIIRDNNASQSGQTKQTLTTTTPTITTYSNSRPFAIRNNMKYEFIFDQYYGPKQNRYQLFNIPIQQNRVPEIRVIQARPIERMPQKQDLEKYPYSKIHTMLLNVARTYSFGIPPYKVNSGVNHDAYRKLSYQTKPMMRVPGTAHLRAPPPESKTLLYPVQKNIHFAVN